jgi:hypothetical protein
MMTQTNAEAAATYLGAADVAKLIRADLKRAFPGVPFRVLSSNYSMGSSVNVSWTDGPIAADVDAIVEPYKAEGFDGSTDSRTNSGPVLLKDGRLVRISSFIFTNRTISDGLRARVSAWFDRHFDGGYSGDKAQEIDRRAWRAHVLNGCLVVRRGF